MKDLFFLLPNIYFFFCIFCLFCLGLRLRKVWLEQQFILIFILSAVVILLSVFLLVYKLPDIQITYFYGYFVLNPLLKFLKLGILMSAVIILLMSIGFFQYEYLPIFEFVMLILLSVFGMVLLVDSNDLFLIYLTVELQSLAFYTLIALKRGSNFSIEASLKYYVMSGFSSCVFLLGLSLIYGYVGTLNFTLLGLFFGDLIEDSLILNFGVFLSFVGIFFKLGLAPFHYWIADVYEGSSIIITAFFSTVSKIAFVCLLLKMYLLFSFSFSFICNVMFYFSLISIFLGSILSLYQVKIRRLIGYSSIVHIGFITLGISLNTLEGLVGSILYLIIYVFLCFNLFSILIVVKEFYSDYKSLDKITDFVKLFRNNFLCVLIFSFTIFSMGGMPPFAGFFSKLYILIALINSGDNVVAYIVLLVTVLSIVYYIRLIRFIFFNRNVNVIPFVNLLPFNKILSFIIVCTFFFNILFFFLHSPLLIYLPYLIILSS